MKKAFKTHDPKNPLPFILLFEELPSQEHALIQDEEWTFFDRDLQGLVRPEGFRSCCCCELLRTGIR